ncbi:hypothetical protein NPIL_535831, partial [Nephila pilipes]
TVPVGFGPDDERYKELIFKERLFKIDMMTQKSNNIPK